MKTVLILISLWFCLSANGAYADSAKDQVSRALSARHQSASVDELQKIAGSADDLVKILLELRNGSPLPFVSVRATRMLVTFSDRSDVQSALLNDLNASNRKGLARIITLHLEHAPSTTARTVLGRAAIERSKRDASFGIYTRELKRSADPNLRKLASE